MDTSYLHVVNGQWLGGEIFQVHNYTQGQVYVHSASLQVI